MKENFIAAAELIKKAKNIVLIPHAKMDCDGMSSAVAMYLLLKQMGKNPTAVCTDPVPEAFAFLPSTSIFHQAIPKSQHPNDFVITVDVSDKGFENLKHEVKDGKVNIVLSSLNAPLEETDFSFLSGDTQPDLIITLDSGDIPQLGSIYSDNIDLFHSVPVINIDHHISNTQFGTMNLVEMKSSSTTEIIFDLLPYLDERGKNMITEDIATLLLAGMITDTGSFQHSNTTPKALDTAAELIEMGARQQEIIKHIFKTKSLATLRLWGRVLTKLKNDPVYRLVWSSVSADDLHETLAHSEDSEGLIDELLSTTPGTEMVILVKEREDGVIGTSVRTSSGLVDAVEFTKKFGGGGHRQAAGFKIRERGGKSFDEIVADIIFEAKNFQGKRLGIDIPAINISEIAQPEEKIVAAESVADIPLEYQPKEENTHYDLPITHQEDHSIIEAAENTENRETIEKPAIAEEIENQAEQREVENIEPAPEPVLPQEHEYQHAAENTENSENEINTSPTEDESSTADMERVSMENPAVPDSDEAVIESFGDILSHQEEEQDDEEIFTEDTSIRNVDAESKIPDFLAVEDTPEEVIESIDAQVEEETTVQNHTEFIPTVSSEEGKDEFAMFLSNAKEKEEEAHHDDIPVMDSSESFLEKGKKFVQQKIVEKREEDNRKDALGAQFSAAGVAPVLQDQVQEKIFEPVEEFLAPVEEGVTEKPEEILNAREGETPQSSAEISPPQEVFSFDGLGTNSDLPQEHLEPEVSIDQDPFLAALEEHDDIVDPLSDIDEDDSLKEISAPVGQQAPMPEPPVVPAPEYPAYAPPAYYPPQPQPPFPPRQEG